MEQISIVGSILGSSGYDIHTRSLANSISKLNEVKLITQVPQGTEMLLTDKEVDSIKKQDKQEIKLIITNPLHWRLHLNAKRNWVFLIFEGDKIPRHYLDECLNPEIEYIFVASRHTYGAILKTYYEVNKDVDSKKDAKFLEKVKIMPHGVDLNLFYSKDKPIDVFRFLCNKGWRNLEDRGGTQYAIRAYLEEFTSKDKAEMVVKINPAYGIPNIQQLLEELKPKNKTDFPRLIINMDNLPYNKLVDLYNQCHVFVQPTRAEAFGIPGIEAMTCGLPVITTNFGGQTEYCNKENSWLIGGELEEVKHELMYEGIKWLTPNVSELRKAMREAYESKELVKQKSEEALKTAKQFTWDFTAKKIVDLI